MTSSQRSLLMSTSYTIATEACGGNEDAERDDRAREGTPRRRERAAAAGSLRSAGAGGGGRLRRAAAISYAAYRVLYRRYQISPGAYVSLPSFDDLLTELGYDYRVTDREGNSPADSRRSSLAPKRGSGHRCTASQNTSSQPWNTTIRPMKRTPGNCRASRSSARYRSSCAVASRTAAATPASSADSPP